MDQPLADASASGLSAVVISPGYGEVTKTPAGVADISGHRRLLGMIQPRQPPELMTGLSAGVPTSASIAARARRRRAGVVDPGKRQPPPTRSRGGGDRGSEITEIPPLITLSFFAPVSVNLTVGALDLSEGWGSTGGASETLCGLGSGSCRTGRERLDIWCSSARGTNFGRWTRPLHLIGKHSARRPFPRASGFSFTRRCRWWCSRRRRRLRLRALGANARRPRARSVRGSRC